jgi:hypothetical protein
MEVTESDVSSAEQIKKQLQRWLQMRLHFLGDCHDEGMLCSPSLHN